MTREQRSRLLMVVYVALLIFAVVLILRLDSSQEEQAKKIGFISTGALGDGMGNETNYQGIRKACQNLGVGLLTRESVPEHDGSCHKAVQELVDEGAEMIILSSPSYYYEMKELFDEYPQTAFYNVFANWSNLNLTGYSTRIYQARYLSGIVAGMQTKTDKVGFVATNKANEVYRGINAFALGVRRVNPDAEIVVDFSGIENVSDDAAQAARALIREEGVDVITHHQGQQIVVTTAEEEGVASIGYYEAVEGASDKYLTCVVCDWTTLYEQLIREHMRGQSSYMQSSWLGLESGVIGLTGYSPLVSQETRDEVERARQEILSGLDVFTNEIYDNEGNLRCGAGEAMSDETLMQHMDWLVEGVRVYE